VVVTHDRRLVAAGWSADSELPAAGDVCGAALMSVDVAGAPLKSFGALAPHKGTLKADGAAMASAVGANAKVGRRRLKPVLASTEQDVVRLGSLTQRRRVILCNLITYYDIENAWFQCLKCGEFVLSVCFNLNCAATSRLEEARRGGGCSTPPRTRCRRSLPWYGGAG